MLVSRVPLPLPGHVTSGPLPPCSRLGDLRVRESGGDSCSGAARAPPLSVTNVFTLYVPEAQALGREGGREGYASSGPYVKLWPQELWGVNFGAGHAWGLTPALPPQGLESFVQIIQLRFRHLQNRRKTVRSILERKDLL